LTNSLCKPVLGRRSGDYARGSFDSNEHGPVLLAEVRQFGLKDYLQNHLADTFDEVATRHSNLHVVDLRSLSSLAADERGMIMLVTPKMLVVGGDAGSVRQMSAQLDAGATPFAGTDFGQRITTVYSQRGAEILVAANIGQILNSTHGQQGDRGRCGSSGFSDIKYLIATRGESSSQEDNRITLNLVARDAASPPGWAAHGSHGFAGLCFLECRRSGFFRCETTSAHAG